MTDPRDAEIEMLRRSIRRLSDAIDRSEHERIEAETMLAATHSERDALRERVDDLEAAIARVREAEAVRSAFDRAEGRLREAIGQSALCRISRR